MIVLGMDPGLKGAIARLTDDDELWIEDVPTLPCKPKGNEVNIPVLNEIIETLSFEADHAFIEQVSSMPKQGVATTFKFGETYGAQRALVVAHGVPVTYIPPSKWKPEIGLTKDKNLSRTRATQLFPKFAHYFKRAKDDGRAEAALIAYYGRQRILRGEKIVQPL